MEMPSTQPTILLIGSDDRLAYLLARYAEQSALHQVHNLSVPQPDEIKILNPVSIIFLSLETLVASQTLIEDVSAGDVLVLACVALADEARAREFGADACLIHPLTYADFQAAIASVVK